MQNQHSKKVGVQVIKIQRKYDNYSNFYTADSVKKHDIFPISQFIY